jgi:hypothetical protein
MIEIAQLTDSDIGRRVLYEVAPGIENPAQLGAWDVKADTLVLFIPTTEHKGLHPVFNVDPETVRWADRLVPTPTRNR